MNNDADLVISILKDLRVQVTHGVSGLNVNLSIDDLRSVLPGAVHEKLITDVAVPVEEEIEVEEQEFEEIEIEEPYMERVGGVCIERTRKVKKIVPKTEEIEVVDEAGRPVYDSGRPKKVRVPVTRKVRKRVTNFVPGDPFVVREVRPEFLIRFLLAATKALAFELDKLRNLTLKK